MNKLDNMFHAIKVGDMPVDEEILKNLIMGYNLLETDGRMFFDVFFQPPIGASSFDSPLFQGTFDHYEMRVSEVRLKSKCLMEHATTIHRLITQRFWMEVIRIEAITHNKIIAQKNPLTVTNLNQTDFDPSKHFPFSSIADMFPNLGLWNKAAEEIEVIAVDPSNFQEVKWLLESLGQVDTLTQIHGMAYPPKHVVMRRNGEGEIISTIDYTSLVKNDPNLFIRPLLSTVGDLIKRMNLLWPKIEG